MPSRPAHPCAWPGCVILTRTRYCPTHQPFAAQRDRARRGTAASRGYDAAWHALSQQVLHDEPACRRCGAPATEVHHRIPIKLAPMLRLVRSNCVPLCHRCHMQVEARRRTHAR